MTEWTNPKNSKLEMTSDLEIDEGKQEAWRREIEQREMDRRREEGIRWLGGPVPFSEFTFDKFNPDLNKTHRYKKIVQEFNISKGNLYLLGPVGTGKTHLMTAKAHQVFDLGGTVRVFNKSTYMELLEYSGWLTVLKGLSFIGLDDIDEFGPGKRVQSAIKLMIQERQNWGKSGMFITTNKPLATLGLILGGKIEDRIDGHFQNLIIPPETPSARGILKQQRRAERVV